MTMSTPFSEPMVYLDHAAAASVSADIAGFLAAAVQRCQANPEAAHGAGRDCRKALAEAAESLAETLFPGGGYQVFWMPSATDAMSLVGTFPELGRVAVATTPAEHPALEAALRRMPGDRSVRACRLGRDGRLDPEGLAECLDAGVGLVAVHDVQNETGVRQDLTAIRAAMRRRCPDAVLMVDTVQSAGKLPIPWREAEIDLAFVAGHKLGAPAGAALLWHGRRLPGLGRWLREVRERDHRIGRPDPAIALTLAEAVRRAEAGRASRVDMVARLNARLRQGLRSLSLPKDATFAEVPAEIASPYIVSCRLPPYQGAVLVRMLSERGIMVAAGSACEAERQGASRALLAMGVPRHEAFSALRFSFWEGSTEAEVDRLLATLPEIFRVY
jgi:cysteine desulfurase